MKRYLLLFLQGVGMVTIEGIPSTSSTIALLLFIPQMGAHITF